MAHDEAVSPAGAAGDIRGSATPEGGAATAVVPSGALPAENLNKALPELRRPFTPEAIRFKIQTAFKDNAGCIIVAYIDARLVIERLNAVAGANWTAEYAAVQAKDDLLRCDLTVFDTTRRDVGQSSKKMSKDLISDALKRAAVHFGVGVSVYALPEIKLMRDQTGRLEVTGNKLMISEHGHKKLREGYATWLAEHGARLFGEPFDHGDVEGSTIDEESEAEPEFVPEAPPALEDERATALVEDMERLYAEIADVPDAAEKFPPAQFRAWLDQSRHSHEALERLQTYVRARHAELVGGAA